MPCAAPPRGFTDTKLPWNDVIQNNPCGLPTLLTAGGVSVSAENLCIFHWAAKHGLTDLKAPNAATGATAGAPGSWTPAGANPPASPAALIAGNPIPVVASPATAWTTGQYVQTNTSGAPGQAYWNGTAWVAGTAP